MNEGKGLNTIQYVVITLLTFGVLFGFFMTSGVFGDTRIGITLFTTSKGTNVDLENGLVGHWTFDAGEYVAPDSGSEVKDRTSNANHGNTEGTGGEFARQPGVIGSAFAFQGPNDRVDMGDPAGGELDFNASEPFTLSFWVKMDSDDGQFVTKRGGEGYQVRVTSGAGLFVRIDEICCGNTQAALYPNPLADGAWHHVVAGRSATEVFIILDNYATSSTISGGTNDIRTATAFSIGATESGAEDFDGFLDDVRIYNRVLTNEEIERLYGLGATTKVGKTLTSNTDLEDGLVGHWPFDGAYLDLSNATNEAEHQLMQ